MKSISLFFFFNFFFFFLSSSFALPAKITILYSGSTFGELRPCGCAPEGDLGGLARRAAFFEQERKNNSEIIILDGGDNLSSPSEQGKLKNGAILQGMELMNYSAVIPGEKDFSLGSDFLKKSLLPWLGANLYLKEERPRGVKDFFLKEFPEDKLTLGIMGILDPELFYFGKGAEIRIEEPYQTANRLGKELKKKGVDIIIILGHLKRKTAQKLAELKEIDLIINGHLEEGNTSVPRKEVILVKNKVIAEVYESGKAMGKLTLSLDFPPPVQSPDEGGKLSERRRSINSHNEYILLTKKYPEEKKQAEIYKKYNQEVSRLFLETMQKKSAWKENREYLGEKECRKCHQDEYLLWQKSKHYRAFSALEKIAKHYDPECLICHTTGFKEEGGFLSSSLTPELINVQCEVCHGKGKKHPETPQNPYGKGAKMVCPDCHTPKNSPAFDFKSYWEKIRH